MSALSILIALAMSSAIMLLDLRDGRPADVPARLAASPRRPEPAPASLVAHFDYVYVVLAKFPPGQVIADEERDATARRLARIFRDTIKDSVRVRVVAETDGAKAKDHCQLAKRQCDLITFGVSSPGDNARSIEIALRALGQPFPDTSHPGELIENDHSPKLYQNACLYTAVVPENWEDCQRKYMEDLAIVLRRHHLEHTKPPQTSHD